MASQSDKYIISSMTNVLIISVDGVELAKEQSNIDKKVEAKVKGIINKLKQTHEKFIDTDFGPKEKDEYGAISFYGDAKPAPAGSKYPDPSTLRWERPQYADDKFDGAGGESKEGGADEVEGDEDDDEDDEFGFGGGGGEEENEIWCTQGDLFVDGSSSGDVIQGQLGDCWFLSALAVMGANESLLTRCFWRGDAFKEFGLYVVRFYKDCSVIFVIIDDRLPVKSKDMRLIFAGNKDPNELWVPLIEKAYAKLHGCYKALIGGFTHYGLADMTGFCPRLVVMREGYLGYSEKYEDDDIWELLNRYKEWNSLMGCSIQSNPKVKSKPEADAGNGLHMGHAYSLLGFGEINAGKAGKLKLVKLRNPWGRGEWEGAFGDRSEEYDQHKAEIERVFNSGEREQERLEQNFNDGTFVMTFKDWLANYTSLFIAVNFPEHWTGKRTQGKWTADKGGNRDMGTWISNPKVKLRLEPLLKRAEGISDDQLKYRRVFIGLYIKDPRLTMGFNYYTDPLYATPLAFDIVTEDLLSSNAKQREVIPHAFRRISKTGKAEEAMKQPPYNFGTTQIEVYLEVGRDYYIVPSLYKRNQPGTFFLNVFADVEAFHLDGSIPLAEAQKPMVIGPPQQQDKQVTLKMSQAQFYDKKEQLRERIVAEAKRLHFTVSQLKTLFDDVKEKLTRSAFKRRMLDMGFMLTDFPDEDLVVLDADNDGTISPQEFIDFIMEGQKFAEAASVGPSPDAPPDDLLYKTVDLSGELSVTISGARYLREATTWFNSADIAEGRAIATGQQPVGTGAGAGAGASGAVEAALAESTAAVKRDPMARPYITYDPKVAAELRERMLKAREAAEVEALKPKGSNLSERNLKAGDATGTGHAASAANVEDLLEMDAENENPLSPFSPMKTTTLTTANMRKHEHHHSGSSTRLGGHTSIDTRGLGATGTQGAGAFTAVTGMSVTQKEVVQRAGMAAAVKLHSDPHLQKAEVTRTKGLSALRTYKKNKAELEGGAEGVSSGGGKGGDAEGMLRKKTKVTRKKKRRDITKDRDAMTLLNYWPNGISPVDSNVPSLAGGSGADGRSGAGTAPVSVRPASEIAGSTGSEVGGKPTLPSAPTAVQEKPTQSQHPVQQGRSVTQSRYVSMHGDLWDYLVDCVITISISRPKGDLALERLRTLTNMSPRNIAPSAFAIFNQPRTPIDRPSRLVTPSRIVKGHIATPRSVRASPGFASVASHQSRSKQKSVVLDAKERLRKLEQERAGSFEEVYRRLLLVPVTSPSEVDGDKAMHAATDTSMQTKSHAYLRTLFTRFDKNENGLISRDEFKLAMEELNVEINNEDCNIFFNRFASKKPGNINWEEFIEFFDSQPIGITNQLSKRKINIIDTIMRIKTTLHEVVKVMTENKISTLDKFLQYAGTVGASIAGGKQSGEAPLTPSAPIRLADARSSFGATIRTSTTGEEFVLPDNAIIQSLSASQVKTSVESLRKLGVKVSPMEMTRISRIFRNDAKYLMDFIRSPDPSVDLHAVIELADGEIMQGFASRIGHGKADDASSIAKLWTGLAPSLKSKISYETLCTYLAGILLESEGILDESLATGVDLPGASDNGSASAAESGLSKMVSMNIPPISTVASSGSSTGGNRRSSGGKMDTPFTPSVVRRNRQGSSAPAQVHGIDAEILCRMIGDVLLCSNWNKEDFGGSSGGGGGQEGEEAGAVGSGSGSSGGSSSDKGAQQGDNAVDFAPQHLSFSGLDAYIRNAKIRVIERKLRYLMQLESNYSGSAVYLLVRMFVNRTQDQFVLVARDPLSGDFYKLERCEDLKALPIGDVLAKLFVNGKKYEELALKVGGEVGKRMYNPDSVRLYNPWDTPAEDAAVSTMLHRLRLVRSRNNSSACTLLLAEEPKFVDSLKVLLEKSSSLPFFSVVNDLTLSFEVGDEAVTAAAGSAQSTAVVTSSASSVSRNRAPPSIRGIVFGAIRNHKSLYNFLVNTSSSLKVVLSTYNGGKRETFKWTEMLSHLTNYRNPFLTVQLLPKFIAPEEYMYQPVDDSSAFTGEEVADELAVQKGPVDFDGAPHPTWDAQFTFNFTPPLLSACKLLCTEIVKISMDNKYKYVVVMVRESKRTYPKAQDPTKKQTFRFLTMYDPRSATEYQCGVEPTSPLFAEICREDGPSALELIPFMELLSQAAENKELILGPAITPHLELNVYNQNGREQELLGTCKVSISSVLSGSGISDPQWSKLSYTLEKGDSGKTLDTDAGEVEVELRFRGSMEIEAERESKLRIKNSRGGGGGSRVEGIDEKVRAAPRPKRTGTADADVIDVDELLRENDSLRLRGGKLEEKLDEVNRTLEKLMQGGPDAVVAQELQAAKKEQERLVAEKQAETDAKLQLGRQFEELRRTAEQQIAELRAAAKEAAEKAAAARDHESAPVVDPLFVDEHKKLQQDYSALLTETEQLRAATAAADASRRLNLSGSGAALPPPDSLGYHHIEGESVMAVVRGILNVLIDRQEKRGLEHTICSRSPLDGLLRLLNSYSKPDGTIGSHEITAAFADLMIELTTEQIMKIVREIGPSSKHTVLVASVMELFQSELSQMVLKKRRLSRSSGKHSRDPSPSSRSSRAPSPSEEDVFGSRTSLNSAGNNNAAGAGGGGLRQQRPSSAGAGGKRPQPHSLSNSRAAPGSARDPSLNPSPSAGTIDIGKHLRSQSSNALKRGSGGEGEGPREGGGGGSKKQLSQTAPATPVAALDDAEDGESPAPSPAPAAHRPAAPAPVVAAQEGGDAPVDWTTVSLPPNWERRFHASSNRHVYINHDTKKTQWHHPLDTSKATRGKSKGGRGRG